MCLSHGQVMSKVYMSELNFYLSRQSDIGFGVPWPLKVSANLNPLSPNSDQRQFCPNNIHMLPRGIVMRVNKMITKEKMLWSAIKLSQLILLRNVWRSVWRIYMWTLGLKGLIDVWLYHSKWKKKLLFLCCFQWYT